MPSLPELNETGINGGQPGEEVEARDKARMRDRMVAFLLQDMRFSLVCGDTLEVAGVFSGSPTQITLVLSP